MIANGDSAARNAFRVGLRTDQTPLPIANATQELDACDILEVQDLAEAIARAEEQIVVRGFGPPSGDIFEALGRGTRQQHAKRTDDTAGPAMPAPSMPTPLPAPFPREERALELQQEIAPPPRYVISVPSTPTSPDDDAYFHPIGRMRTLADVTLDGYRPEPTLLLLAQARRKRLSWVLVAVLLPLIVLGGFAMFGRTDATGAALPSNATNAMTATTTNTPATNALATNVAPPTTAVTAPSPATTNAGAAAHGKTVGQSRGIVPVFDVKSLPSAGTRNKTRGH